MSKMSTTGAVRLAISKGETPAIPAAMIMPPVSGELNNTAPRR